MAKQTGVTKARLNAEAKAEKAAKAKAAMRDAAHPYRRGCHGQDAWELVWPKLRVGKPITMVDMVSAWERVIVARNLATTGNTQSAKARAGQFVTGCLGLGLLAHTEQAGVYVYGGKYPLPTKTPKAPTMVTPPTAQAEAPATAEGTE